MARVKKILIVDSDLVRRIYAGQIMEQFGFSIFYAESNADAVDLYENDPVYDVVAIRVDDCPGINAYTAARLIRSFQMAKRPYVVGIVSNYERTKDAISSGIDILIAWPLAEAKPTGARLSIYPG